jgi:hypothetical protein
MSRPFSVPVRRVRALHLGVLAVVASIPFVTAACDKPGAAVSDAAPPSLAPLATVAPTPLPPAAPSASFAPGQPVHLQPHHPGTTAPAGDGGAPGFTIPPGFPTALPSGFTIPTSLPSGFQIPTAFPTTFPPPPAGDK